MGGQRKIKEGTMVTWKNCWNKRINYTKFRTRDRENGWEEQKRLKTCWRKTSKRNGFIQSISSWRFWGKISLVEGKNVGWEWIINKEGTWCDIQ